MQTTNDKKQGFTLIEVVLVLAIAGLIFLIVFLALPALQRSQRDTQRRNDMSRFMSQIASYQSNNQGNVPVGDTGAGSVTDFRDRYLTVAGDTFADPSTGTVYAVDERASVSDNPTVGTIYYYRNAKCSGESAVVGGGGRTVTIRTQLEGGAYYCQNN